MDIIWTAVRLETQLNESLDWWLVAKSSFELRTDYYNNLPSAPIELVGQIMIHEPLPLAQQSTNFNYAVEYGNARFKPFYGVLSLDDYREAIEADGAAEVGRLPRSPLDLPSALDYLALIVDRSPSWTKKQHLLQLPTFEAAASVTSPPSTKLEFDQRCSDLWTVFNRLQVPEASAEEHEARGWDPARRGSLNELELWRRRSIGPEEESVWVPALRQIRALGQIRQAPQHASRETLRRRDAALQLFGLPSVILNWASAWDMVLAGLADAVHAITLAIRRSLEL